MAALFAPVQHVADAVVSQCTGADPSVCQTGLPKAGSTDAGLQIVLNWTFGVIAAVAVLVIAIAALRLIWAAREGDPQAIPRLRGTIIYAAVGLALALLADAIVGFVLGKV